MSTEAQPPRRLRASDQDRHEAVLALSDHYAEGRLDLDEFTARMARAQEATYVDDLDPLFLDLPARRGVVATRPPDGAPAGRRRRRGFAPIVVAAVIVVAVLAAVHGHFPWWLFLAFWFARMRWFGGPPWAGRVPGRQTMPYSRSPASPRPGTM